MRYDAAGSIASVFRTQTYRYQYRIEQGHGKGAGHEASDGGTHRRHHGIHRGEAG